MQILIFAGLQILQDKVKIDNYEKDIIKTNM
jgi:hypothetical protein